MTSWNYPASGGSQGDREGSEAHAREEEGERLLASTQGPRDQERRRHREVEGEGADDCHHHHRYEEVLVGSDIAKAGSNLALGSFGLHGREQFGLSHHRNPPQNGEVAEAVHQETPGVPERTDQDSGQSGADNPGTGHDGAVEADGVCHVLGRDHFGDERATDGLVECGKDSLHRCQCQNPANGDVVGEYHEAEHE